MEIEKINLEKTDWRSSREFFEGLADELRALDNRDEAYNFTWVGKRKSIIEAGTPINKTLRPVPADSVDFDTTKNLFITGDNLDALKLLQESYLGKVNMIYIDPPYNTGKDFVYHDNFRADVGDYAIESGKKDAAGNILTATDEFTENARSNGRFHSDWLSMMYPRLKLARNLLTDDGVIFISIDDNEMCNMRKLCDEVFGEENFEANVIPIVNPGGRDYKQVAITHEYLLIYSKSDLSEINEISKQTDFSFNDSTGGFNFRELRNRNPKFHSGNRPNLFYFFYINPNNKNKDKYCAVSLIKDENYSVEVKPYNSEGKESVWRWGKVKAQSNIFYDNLDKSQILAKQKIDGNWNIYEKSRKDTTKVKSLWDETEMRTENGTRETRDLFSATLFDHPKPINLLSRCLQMGTNQDSLVLDFFAGSGTTAHAVMKLNAEDGGNRKWILCQLDEPCSEKSEAFKAGYKTIDEISRERIRRAATSIKNEELKMKREKSGQIEFEEMAGQTHNDVQDFGFRALKIDNANEKDNIRKPVDLFSQENLVADIENLKPDRTPLDLLYGVLCQSALPYNRPIQKQSCKSSNSANPDSDIDIYLYDYQGEGTGLVACFAETLPEEVIKQIISLKPLTAVFRESSFSDSQAKINTQEMFKTDSGETKIKVI